MISLLHNFRNSRLIKEVPGLQGPLSAVSIDCGGCSA